MASRTLRSRKQILPSSTQLRGWHTIAPVTFTNNELDLESGEMRGQLPPKRKSTRQGQDPTSFKKQRIQTSSSMTEAQATVDEEISTIQDLIGISGIKVEEGDETLEIPDFNEQPALTTAVPLVAGDPSSAPTQPRPSPGTNSGGTGNGICAPEKMRMLEDERNGVSYFIDSFGDAEAYEANMFIVQALFSHCGM